MNARKLSVIGCSLSVLPLLGVDVRAEKPVRPNVLIIMIDDAGYADFGFMGSKDMRTPNIDRLAASGTIFTDAHVAATVSSPSRACTMTGRYGHRFGYECNPGEEKYGIPLTEATLGEVFQRNGYTTATVGKWHLGKEDGMQPNQRGFDFFYGMLAGGRDYFYDPDKSDRPGTEQNIQRNGKQERFDGYLTDVFSDEAARFMGAAEKPFFLYLSYNAVHTPMQATKEDLALFEGHPRRKLAAMTWALDRGVGQVVEALKASGKFDNTLIFFLSDNGGATTNQSSNLPLKGFKGNKFEGGHRVPFFVVWGDKAVSGGEFAGLTSALDIFATAIDAAGIKAKSLPNALDGVSLLPYLNGKRQGDPHASLFWRKMASRAVRFGDYKLIVTEGVDTVLYNIRQDIAEMSDIRDKEPEKLNHALRLVSEWEKRCVPPLWIENGWGQITDSYHKRLMENQIFQASDLNKKK